MGKHPQGSSDLDVFKVTKMHNIRIELYRDLDKHGLQMNAFKPA